MLRKRYKYIAFRLMGTALLTALLGTSCMTSSAYLQRRRERDLAATALEAGVGQLFMLSLRVDADGAQRKEAVTEVDDEVVRLIREIQPGGIILYGENLVDAAQIVRLIRELQALSATPLFIALDEEGGRVSRLARTPALGSPRLPANLGIGALADPALSQEKGTIIGEQLRVLGFNVAFSVIADIFTNPRNTVIGDRSYGADPKLVSALVAGEVRGILASGVLPVLKHFPGHGDTVEDSHYRTARSNRSAAQLKEAELLPFVAGLEAGAEGIMIGHIAMPAMDPSGLPATFSQILTTGLLRDSLGFRGLVFTDALEMGGAGFRGITGDERALQAFLAGSDVLLVPPRPLDSYRKVLDACMTDDAARQRLDESLRRIHEAKTSLGLLMGSPDFPVLPEWQKFMENRAIPARIENIISAVENPKAEDSATDKGSDPTQNTTASGQGE
jgi:beta-N-acetylhexosaminidase